MRHRDANERAARRIAGRLALSAFLVGFGRGEACRDGCCHLRLLVLLLPLGTALLIEAHTVAAAARAPTVTASCPRAPCGPPMPAPPETVPKPSRLLGPLSGRERRVVERASPAQTARRHPPAGCVSLRANAGRGSGRARGEWRPADAAGEAVGRGGAGELVGTRRRRSSERVAPDSQPRRPPSATRSATRSASRSATRSATRPPLCAPPPAASPPLLPKRLRRGACSARP